MLSQHAAVGQEEGYVNADPYANVGYHLYVYTLRHRMSTFNYKNLKCHAGYPPLENAFSLDRDQNLVILCAMRSACYSLPAALSLHGPPSYPIAFPPP